MKEVFIVNKPELYSFIESTLIDTFLQLARVNIITGEYQYLKQDPDIKKDFEGVTNIYDYMRKFASEKYVYPEFVDGIYEVFRPGICSEESIRRNSETARSSSIILTEMLWHLFTTDTDSTSVLVFLRDRLFR